MYLVFYLNTSFRVFDPTLPPLILIFYLCILSKIFIFYVKIFMIKLQHKTEGQRLTLSIRFKSSDIRSVLLVNFSGLWDPKYQYRYLYVHRVREKRGQ